MQSITFTQPRTKKCPFCSERIQATAIKCRFCGEFLNTNKTKAIDARSAPNSQVPQDEKQAGNILLAARPSLWGMAGSVIQGLLLLGLAAVLVRFPLENFTNNLLGLELTSSQALAFGQYRVIAGLGLAALVLLVLLLKMLRLKMTYYEVSAERIEWSRGILDREVDNLDMFRVVDLKLHRSLLDCIFGIGTVGLITTDKTDPEFTFEKVRHSRRLYDIIKKASLEADRRNAVVHLE